MALSLAVAYGVWYSYSVFLVALSTEYQWSRSTLAAAFSIFALVHGLANPIVGRLSDRYDPALLMFFGALGIFLSLYYVSFLNSPSELFLGFGFFAAISVSFCGWAPSLVQVHNNYKENLGFAIGFISSGIGVGMLVIVPLVQVLIDFFGWREAFKLLAIMCLLTIAPIGIFLYFKPFQSKPRHVNGVKPNSTNLTESSNLTIKRAIRSKTFWLIIGAFFFGSMGSQILHVHQVAFLVESGITSLAAASVVSIVGISSILGKTGGGWLSDFIEREVVFISGNFLMILSVSVLFFAGGLSSLSLAYFFALLLGVGYSANAAIAPAIMSDSFDGPNFGSLLGFGLFASAMGASLGPLIAGELYDFFGAYDIPLLLASICGFFALAMGWSIKKFKN